jgi:hypothetical protein
MAVVACPPEQVQVADMEHVEDPAGVADPILLTYVIQGA